MTTAKKSSPLAVQLKFAKLAAIAAGGSAEHVEEDFDNWLSIRTKPDEKELAMYLAQYIATAQPIPRPEFRMSYSEYANLTSFLPAKGGRGTVVALKRNENNDLLFALEGDTNITRFGQPEE